MSVLISLESIFPYVKWRKGQRELAEEVYRVSKEGGTLFVNYPTGSGKTVAILTGALKAAVEKDLKIYYLVKTKNQLISPINELKKIKSRQKVVTFSYIYNKKDMCLLKSLKGLDYLDFLRYCSFLIKNKRCPYYRKAVKLQGYLSNGDVNVYKYGEEMSVCPYELAKKNIPNTLITISVYNYLFNPDIRAIIEREVNLRLERSILIVDEGHNLPDSIISMLARELRRDWIMRARKEVAKFYKGEDKESIIGELTRLLSYFKYLERKIGGRKYLELNYDEFPVYELDPDKLFKAALAIERREGNELFSPLSYIRKIAEFWKELRTRRAAKVLIFERGFKTSVVKLLYVLPPPDSTDPLRKAHAAIVMSGTLPPAEHLIFTLNLQDKNVRSIGMSSPYAVNLKILGIKGVSSRYTERYEENFIKMAKLIREVYDSLPEGIVLAVFSSYDYLRYIIPYVKIQDVIVERENTTLEEINSKVRGKNKLLIACSAWGKVAEGIEIKVNEKSLIRAIVIAGLPVPEPSSYREKFYEIMLARTRDKDKAWKHTYVIPAVMKVIQALGRSVRSENDRAVAVLLDDRFFEQYVLNIINSYGYKVEEINPRLLKNSILSFFNKA
ncbi:MAG: hypothetical protein DRJ41_02445 [Thermoprotei archaeon]|nr:MAG: hypothetical protein DRJ41_02445 [Thermoprotei archaeon]